MTKREAKRRACNQAAIIVERLAEAEGEADPNPVNDAKIVAALLELSEELFRRAERLLTEKE